MAGMTKGQARKRKKEEPTRKGYQAYLQAMKRSGSMKKAKTYYEWQKMNQHTRNIHYKVARS